MTAFTIYAIQYMKRTLFQLLETVFAVQVKKGRLRCLLFVTVC